VYKDNPLEDAIGALSTADKPAAAPRPAGPSPTKPPPQQTQAAAAAPKPAARPSSFTPFGAQAAAARPAYERTGEGLRDAIKARDVDGVRSLLAAGVAPTYVDAQGMSLLHVACLFDAGDIAVALLEAGAGSSAPNGQGETPLDVAPAALAMRLRGRLAAMQKQAAQ
jgi:ankyrin repeat protein